MQMQRPKYLCGPRGTRARRRLKILLVDENETDLRLFQETFLALQIQHELQIVTNNEEALALLTGRGSIRSLPALILIGTDGDGLQVLRAVRKNPKLRAIPVIMLGAMGPEREINQAYELGATAYVCKPQDDFADLIGDLDRFWLRRAELPVDRTGEAAGESE